MGGRSHSGGEIGIGAIEKTDNAIYATLRVFP